MLFSKSISILAPEFNPVTPMRKEFDEISINDTKELTKDRLKLLGGKLKEIRMSSNLTLNDVAFFTYSNISTVERLELGKLKNITLLTLLKFAVFYGVSLPDLLT